MLRNPAAAIDLVLETPEIFLRAPRRGDMGAWVELRRQSRDFLEPWEPAWPSDATEPAAFLRRYRRARREWRAQEAYGFFIFSAASRTLLGGITLAHIRRGVAQTATLGYWMGKPHAGKGHMSAAVPVLLDFAFGTLGLHRVEAACLPNNEVSIRLLLKAGFLEEGIARQYLKIDGAWRDHRTFAILSADRRPAGGCSGLAGVGPVRSDGGPDLRDAGLDRPDAGSGDGLRRAGR